MYVAAAPCSLVDVLHELLVKRAHAPVIVNDVTEHVHALTCKVDIISMSCHSPVCP